MGSLKPVKVFSEIDRTPIELITEILDVSWVHIWKGLVKPRLFTDTQDRFASTPSMTALRVLFWLSDLMNVHIGISQAAGSRTSRPSRTPAGLQRVHARGRARDMGAYADDVAVIVVVEPGAVDQHVVPQRDSQAKPSGVVVDVQVHLGGMGAGREDQQQGAG